MTKKDADFRKLIDTAKQADAKSLESLEKNTIEFKTSIRKVLNTDWYFFALLFDQLILSIVRLKESYKNV